MLARLISAQVLFRRSSIGSVHLENSFLVVLHQLAIQLAVVWPVLTGKDLFDPGLERLIPQAGGDERRKAASLLRNGGSDRSARRRGITFVYKGDNGDEIRHLTVGRVVSHIFLRIAVRAIVPAVMAKRRIGIDRRGAPRGKVVVAGDRVQLVHALLVLEQVPGLTEPFEVHLDQTKILVQAALLGIIRNGPFFFFPVGICAQKINVIKKGGIAAVKGGAAKQVCVRFFRTNSVTQLTTFVVQSIPDTIEMLRGRISKAQFISNLVVGGSTLAGATVGAIFASKWGGWASLGGSIAGGEASRLASKKITEIFHKDDSIKMQKIIKIAMIELSNDYLLQNQTEFDDCIRAIKDDGAISTDLLRCMYAAGKGEKNNEDNDLLRARIAYRALEYYFDVVIRNRRTIHINGKQELLLAQIADMGNVFNVIPPLE